MTSVRREHIIAQLPVAVPTTIIVYACTAKLLILSVSGVVANSWEPRGFPVVLPIWNWPQMNDGQKQKHREQVVRAQMRLGDFKEAFRSQYKVVPNEERFNELLKRLEQAEQNQPK